MRSSKLTLAGLTLLPFAGCDLFPSVPPEAWIRDSGAETGAGGTAVAGHGGDAGASGQGTGGSSAGSGGAAGSAGSGGGSGGGAAGAAGGSGSAGTTGDVLAVFPITDGLDDLNEDGNDYEVFRPRVWLGTGEKKNDSHTAFRFLNVTVPRGATIQSARLELYVPIGQAADMQARITAEASDNCMPYTVEEPPSARGSTQAYRDLAPTEPWLEKTPVSIDDLAPIIAEVVGRPGWEPGAALCIQAKGQGDATMRRRVGSYDGDAQLAPRLEVVYSVE